MALYSNNAGDGLGAADEDSPNNFDELFGPDDNDENQDFNDDSPDNSTSNALQPNETVDEVRGENEEHVNEDYQQSNSNGSRKLSSTSSGGHGDNQSNRSSKSQRTSSPSSQTRRSSTIQTPPRNAAGYPIYADKKRPSFTPSPTAKSRETQDDNKSRRTSSSGPARRRASTPSGPQLNAAGFPTEGRKSENYPYGMDLTNRQTTPSSVTESSRESQETDSRNSEGSQDHLPPIEEEVEGSDASEDSEEFEQPEDAEEPDPASENPGSRPASKASAGSSYTEPLRALHDSPKSASAEPSPVVRPSARGGRGNAPANVCGAPTTRGGHCQNRITAPNTHCRIPSHSGQAAAAGAAPRAAPPTGSGNGQTRLCGAPTTRGGQCQKVVTLPNTRCHILAHQRHP